MLKNPLQNTENHENLFIPSPNHENHEIHKTPLQNQETNENLINPCQNYENHEILKIPCQTIKKK